MLFSHSHPSKKNERYKGKIHWWNIHVKIIKEKFHKCHKNMIVVMKARSNRDYNILNKITEAEKKPKIKKTSKFKIEENVCPCMHSMIVSIDSWNTF